MHRVLCLLLLAAGMTTTACTTAVQVTHHPLVAKSTESIVFTAVSLTNTTPDSIEIEIFVNDELKKTCTSSPCTFTGGPYPSLENGYVHYFANITAEYTFDGKKYTHHRTDGYHFTGIADANYNWNNKPYIPGRITGFSSEKEDLVFHMADDYKANNLTMSDFLVDASFKVREVFGQQAIVAENLSKFNFWVYRKTGKGGGCGTPDSAVSTDMPFRDDDVVLHAADFQDCTNPGLTTFSAEGSNTKAFLHEGGHAVFGLGDEYDGDTNYASVQSPQPNIFDTQNECQTEQTSQGRNPSVCREFTTNGGGWWTIHPAAMNTVMVRGLVGDPWYTEAAERVRWYFSNF